MQLVTDCVTMYDTMKDRRLGIPEVIEKFGVPPEKVVEVQALAGDSTDNVPGVPGIGVKTAAELINTYGDLDTLLARAGEIKQPKRRETLLANADKARLSRDLVRLRDDCDVPEKLGNLDPRRPDPATLRAFLETQGFRSLLTRLQGEGVLASAPAAEAKQALPPTPAPAKERGPARYVLIQDLPTLQAWVARAREAGAVAFDTETSSLDAVRAELIGLSLAIEPGEAAYVPIGHCTPGGPAEGELALAGQRELIAGQLPCDGVIAALKSLLEDPAILKIGHNIKFDACVLRRYGVAIAPIDDTMLLSYALDGGAHGHGMDELAQLHLAHRTIT